CACSSPSRAASALTSRWASRRVDSRDCSWPTTCCCNCSTVVAFNAPPRTSPVPTRTMAAAIGLCTRRPCRRCPSECSIDSACTEIVCRVIGVMSDSLPRRSSSPKVPAGAERSATMQTALDALLSGTARDPVRHALGLDALDRQLRPLLPPGLAAHVRLANVTEGRLVFLVDSPVWHARLRLAANELLDAARSLGLEVRDVAIRATTQPLQPLAPSERVAASGSNAGRSVATDEAFRAALAALAEPAPGGKNEG